MKLSIITTLFYSEKYVSEFYFRVREAAQIITQDYELIFVNDGSPDQSSSIVLDLQKKDHRITLVELSKNFGHHQAIVTGLQHAGGDFIFLIDCDLEEDPSLLLVFWEKQRNNNSIDVVYGVQSTRKGGFFERTTGRFFYSFLHILGEVDYPKNTLTARLMKKKYVEAVLSFKEKSLDVWSIFALTGFNQVGVFVNKESKGTSTYTLFKKLKMGIEIITSLTHRPLYSIFFIGLIWLIISGSVFISILIKKWTWGVEIEGWASIMASLWLIGGVIIFLLGIISLYLSKIFIEIKDRPISIIKKIYKDESIK